MFPAGSTAHARELLNNHHTPESVKSQLRSVINHDVITGRANSAPPLTDGDARLWAELRDALLDPYLSPLVAEDLSDLPRTLVYTVAQDPFHDDGTLFARRLLDAGVDVTHVDNDAGFHAMNSLSSSEFSTVDKTESDAAIWDFIKKNL